MMRTSHVRQMLTKAWLEKDFVGNTVEVIGATFVADELTIFGERSEAYVSRELRWYDSQSLNLDAFPGAAPAIWRACADPDGNVNSNYGWCIHSPANGSQYANTLLELQRNPNSRRAEMIYTRPSMHVDATKNGMQDFICTDAVQYFIRSERLIAHMRMRSNDACIGYRNDLAWQMRVHRQLAGDLKVGIGDIIWTAGSIHVYERNYASIQRYVETGEYQ